MSRGAMKQVGLWVQHGDHAVADCGPGSDVEDRRPDISNDSRSAGSYRTAPPSLMKAGPLPDQRQRRRVATFRVRNCAASLSFKRRGMGSFVIGSDMGSPLV